MGRKMIKKNSAIDETKVPLPKLSPQSVRNRKLKLELGIRHGLELEAKTIERAIDGDAEAGFYLLAQCREALVMDNFSPALKNYLMDRITALIDDVEPRQALCIKKPKGRQEEVVVRWQLEIASFGYWLIKNGLSVSNAKEAMHKARLQLYKRGIDSREAGRVLRSFDNLPNSSNRDLQANMGDYKACLAEFLHLVEGVES
jgi:hypothetical protein